MTHDSLEIPPAGVGGRERHLIEMIAEHTNDAFVITEAEPIGAPDGGPRIIYVNAAFERMTGYAAEEVIGKTPRILQSDQTDRRELDRIRRSLERWEKCRSILCNARKDGSTFWVELDIVPVADESGWYRHWIAIQRDVSERVAYQRQLEIARQEAEAASAAKSEFLANMSHELRTPLNAVIGYSDFLKTQLPGPLTVKQQEYVSNIGDSGMHLLDVVGDILDLARIENGRMDLVPESVDLQRLIASVATIARPKAQERRIVLEVPGEDDGLPAVFVDPVRLKQALLNVVTNAVKASPAGETVAVSFARTPEAVTITVSDRGPGLGEEDIRLVMQPFVRLGSAYVASEEGVGLGVPIAASLLRLHGGDLVIRSRSGGGTAVDLVLPAGRPRG